MSLMTTETVLLFSTSRVNQLLREASPVPPGSDGVASVYLAAVLQFLAQRILTLAASNAAADGGSNEIGTLHLSNGMASDEDIARVFNGPAAASAAADGATGDFSSDLVKVLEADNNKTTTTTLSADALPVMNSHLQVIFARIVHEAGKLCIHLNRDAMSFREIQTAIRLLLPFNLSKGAVEAGTQAVAAYSA